MKARFFYVAFPMLVDKTPHKLSFGNIISEILRCRFRALRKIAYVVFSHVGRGNTS